MTEHDLAMLYEWLNRSHIVEWWGEKKHARHSDDVQEQYLPSVLAQESVTPHCNAEWRADWVCPVVRCSWKRVDEEETDPGVRGIDQSLANASQLKGFGTKLVRALVELLFNDPEVTKIQTDPSPSNLRAIRCYEKAGLERQGTVTTPDGPAVYMVQTRCAFERTRSVAQLFHRGTSKGWRSWPPLMSNVKHHEGSGDRRSIDSTIRGSWRHRAPSRTDVAGRTFVRLRSGWRPEATDIDLLVTVTVRLDETTRRALINDLLKLRLPLERARFSAL